MTDATAAPPAPTIPDLPPQEVAPGVWVLPDGRVDLVPNVGVVVGEDAALVVDTGMGAENGRRVLERARALAGDRPLLLTITHFHPEHGWGAQVFRSQATILYNEAQRLELEEKFAPFVELFSTFSPAIAEILADVELVAPRLTYSDEARIELGGVVVGLRAVGTAHTRGDQIVWLPKQRVLFAGDLVENRFFPILPDEDAHGSPWIDVLGHLEALEPAVVVPGHGEVGDAGLIREVRGYLELVRTRYADWDNPVWIPFAIERFHAELDG
jgi:glyoxylase-like metal-dependent hydrolase (beta-lactamase superfamily II)